MIKQAPVVFADTTQGLGKAVKEIFEPFGGAKSLLKKSKDVYIKVNAVDHKKHAYTDPGVLEAVIMEFQSAGARNIYVIENCTQGNLTRLVFAATGIASVCTKTGAIPVYLDETGVMPVFLEGISAFVDISDFVYERLVLHGGENLYVSIPKLKTHSMSQVTLSVKNQFGFVHQHSRIADHNFRLHQKFADIYKILRPDFVVIDGIVATNHGHYIAQAFEKECVEKTDCLIGGNDPLAVDITAASFLGFSWEKIQHLALCAATKISRTDPDRIEIIGDEIYQQRRKNFTCKLLGRVPEGINIIRGKERCCIEGCRMNTETVMEVLGADYNGKGGFTVLMGKGFDNEIVQSIRPPVHIAGSCAYTECGHALQKRFGKKKVTVSIGCNNLPDTITGLCRQMKVHPLSLSELDPLRSLYLLAKAKWNGSLAMIPSLI